MIEIELKYELKGSLDINFEATGKKIVEDIYYDTGDYKLLRKGNFLRIRNGKQLDFKLSVDDLSHLYCRETNFDLNNKNLSEINRILNSVGVDINLSSVEEVMTRLKVLAPIRKERVSYRLEENIVMVIDKVDDLGGLFRNRV